MGLNMHIYKVIDKCGSYIVNEAIYWRKTNSVHGWFVRNCQNGINNGAVYYVSKSQLELLKSTCEKVLEDNSLADELLPVFPGFFYGRLEYDDVYFGDLEYTIKN